MSLSSQAHPADPTPEATAIEHAQRAVELALQVRDEHPDDVGAWQAWEALATARAVMYGAYSADDFLYSARAAAEVAVRRALHLMFDIAFKYHHPDPGRASWHLHYDDHPAIGAWRATADASLAALDAAYPRGSGRTSSDCGTATAQHLRAPSVFSKRIPGFTALVTPRST